MVAFYGFHVGKYTVRPMDPSWDLKRKNHLRTKPQMTWGFKSRSFSGVGEDYDHAEDPERKALEERPTHKIPRIAAV